MKRTLVQNKIRGFLVAAVTAAIAGLGLAGSAAAETKITYGAYVPAKHTMIENGLLPYFAAVEKQTGGSVKFEFFPGGAIASGKASLAAVRDGLMDGGVLVDLYSPQQMAPLTVLSGYALFGDNTQVVTAAVNETVLLDCPECISALKDQNVKPLGFYSTTPYVLMCNKPVASISDVKGLKLRGLGAWGGWVTAMGAVPVNVTSAEAYEAMGRGQVDCVIGSVAWLKSYSLWDVAKSVTTLPMGTYPTALALSFNTNTWDKLSAAEKKVLIDNTPEMISNSVNAYDSDEVAVNKAAAEKGLSFTEPSADLVNLLTEYRKSERARVIEATTKRGVKGAEAILSAYEKNTAKWKKIVADIGGDPVKFTAALKAEIFDKL